MKTLLLLSFCFITAQTFATNTIVHVRPRHRIPLPCDLDIDRDKHADLRFSYSVLVSIDMYAVPLANTELLTFNTTLLAPLSKEFPIGPVRYNYSWTGTNSLTQAGPILMTRVHFSELGTSVSGFFIGGITYVGCAFEKDGSTHYGWIRIRTKAGTVESEILDWAYEKRPDTAILAGKKRNLAKSPQ